MPAPAPLTDRRRPDEHQQEVDVVVEEKIVVESPVVEDGKMVLRTDNLVKKYGKRTVANHVSIDVTQCEIAGLRP